MTRLFVGSSAFLLFVAGLIVVAASGIACSSSDGESIAIDACDSVHCGTGLTCDSNSGQCRCDEVSCGEGMACIDGTECVEDPQQICIWGTAWDDENGCQCNPSECDDDQWSCSQDGSHCELDDAGDTCVDGSPWPGDIPVFRDASEEAGFVDLGVEGVRLSTVDVTGNGWSDLLVRRALAGSDDFSDDGTRHTWLLRNNGDGSFEDITETSGLLQRRYDASELGRPAEVMAFADINNSGALDIVTLTTISTSSDNAEGAEILFNDGTGNFELGPVSEPLHAAGEVVSRSGASFVDIDRNGFVDLWMGQGGRQQDRLLQGDGTGEFVDITAERGLSTSPVAASSILNEADGHSNAWSVASCDLTGDGRTELLAASYGRAPNHLWSPKDEGDVTAFENHSIDSGYAFDHRQDWTDNESARCYCMHTPEAEDCDGVPAPEYILCNSAQDAFRWNHQIDREPFRLGGNSGTTVCADLNNNGMLDLLTTEIVHWDVGESSDPSEILYNTGETPLRFERPGNENTGLTRSRGPIPWDDGDITAAVFDFDNDGRLDILIASTDYPETRALLYHQQQDGTFQKVPVDLGIDLTSAHGIAVADFNQSGALDVVIGHSRSRCGSGDHCLDESHVRLFENTLGGDNNWLQLKLEGSEGTNRAAVGARVTVEIDDLMQVSEVGGGHGHYGMQHDLVQHFGLSDSCEATVTIEWPDANNTTEIYRLPAGERYHIQQGQAPAVVE